MSETNIKAFARAIEADKTIPGYFARSISALHRAASARQQAAIWQMVCYIGRQNDFRLINGALVEASL